MSPRPPPRLVLLAAALVAVAGIVSVIVHDPASTVLVAARGGVSSGSVTQVSAAPSSTSSTVSPFVPDASGTTSSTSTTVPARTAPGPRAAGPPSSTSVPSTATTSTTVFDWQKAGWPGPPGSIPPAYTEAPYTRTNHGARSTMTVSASANGGRPGDTITVTVQVTWAKLQSEGSVTLRGPLDYTKPDTDQTETVLGSWTKPCPVDPFLAGEQRTYTFDVHLGSQPDQQYQLFTTMGDCMYPSGRDAYVALDFASKPAVALGQPSGPLHATG